MPHRPLTAALGLPPEAEELYRQVLPGSGRPLDEIARGMLLTPEALRAQLAPLVARDVVRLPDGLLEVAPPAVAVARYVARQGAALATLADDLGRVADQLPTLAADGDRPLAEGGDLGDVIEDDQVVTTIVSWMRESTGEVCFLRPDQWLLPTESAMAEAVRVAVGEGRRVRAIYPARALREAPATLLTRARAGEEIRIAPEVMTRMAVVGTSFAMLPERLGIGGVRRLALRQTALVELAQAYFDYVWDRAASIPHLERSDLRPDLRRLLLRQLAEGVKDEQIARNLDVSLRTVRRRVASLMIELGVDTRFQAGVEAVRRGWL